MKKVEKIKWRSVWSKKIRRRVRREEEEKKIKVMNRRDNISIKTLRCGLVWIFIPSSQHRGTL